MRSNGKTAYNGFVAERRTCLGVLICHHCRHRVRPKTHRSEIERQLSMPCPNTKCSQVALQKITCLAYTLVYQDGDTLRWIHSGIHNHERPPGGALSRAEERAVDMQVGLQPGATAFQLRTGNAVPGSVPLAHISPVLAEPRRARNEVSKSHKRRGDEPEGSSKNGNLSIFDAIEQLERKFGSQVVVGSQLSRPGYIAVQNDWMRLVLKEAVADWLVLDDGPGATRHGFVTDADHSFFQCGSLLVSVAFNTTLSAWIPVLYTWVHKLDTAHHQAHFLLLNRCVISAAGANFDRKMLAGVCGLLLLRSLSNLIHFV